MSRLNVLAVVIFALALPTFAAVPRTTSWYGDPAAPDISGVWIRAAPAVSGSPEGWTPWPPRLKGDFAATYAKRLKGPRTDDPIATCLPPGMPRFMTGMTGPLLIVQTPGRVTISRAGLPVRRIWTDGRALPKSRDLEQFFGGNSIGRYKGAVLVTTVAGMRNQPLDATGIPHSDELTLTERFHRVDASTLAVDITATDPTAFTGPLTTHVTYTASPDPRWEPREILCTPATDTHPDQYVH